MVGDVELDVHEWFAPPGAALHASTSYVPARAVEAPALTAPNAMASAAAKGARR
jgi:hypothetical protein